MVWYFIGVYVINRTLHGRLEIQHFSSSVEKYFTSVAQRTSEIFFQHEKRNFVSPRGHVISSIFFYKKMVHWTYPGLYMLSRIQAKFANPVQTLVFSK